MKTRIIIVTVIFPLLALAADIALCAGHNEAAAYRLIASDPEEVAPPAPEVPEKFQITPPAPNNLHPQEPGYPDEMLHGNGYGPVGQSEGLLQGNCGGGDYCGNDCCSSDCCQPCCCCPRWTATADFIVFDRVGGKSQTLAQNAPITGALGALNANDEVVNSNDFKMGFHSGPRLSLIHHGCGCYDLELLYFGIDGWSSSRSLPYSQRGYVTYVSGDMFYSNGPLLAEYSSRLYNAELNLRWNPYCRLTMLAGFRWAELRENLIGFEGVTDTMQTSWNPIGSIKTENDLYGFQIGADAKLLDCCCFSIDGLIKTGIYNNQASQTSESYDDGVYRYSASSKHPAFIGELGLMAKYQVTKCFSLRAGYQVLWLDGVAVAPAQINDVNSIDTNGGLFYHGASAGLEYSF